VIGAIAGVRACAVVGVPDPLWGEAVTAAIVADPDAPDDAAIIAEVKARRGNAAAPKRIVRLAELPQTAIGKIDKKILRSIVATQ
jgi:fatty-acyl-CoA synthase